MKTKAAKISRRPSKRKRTAGSLKRVVRRYSNASHALAKLRSELFPPKSIVHVECDRYTGPGKVVSDGGCPIDQLPVQVGNGNVWWYPLTFCSPNDAGQPRGD
jgi:hypothetical protein